MSVSPDASPVASMIDAGVRLGYPASRRPGQPLELAGGARLRSGTVLYDASRIGASFETGHSVVVREDCEIGEHVSIWSNTVVDYGCHIGDRVKIHANCYIAQFTVIEDDAFLAPGVTIANDLYPGDDESARLMAGPHIGAGAQIGVNVTILPFVRIGAGRADRLRLGGDPGHRAGHGGVRESGASAAAGRGPAADRQSGGRHDGSLGPASGGPGESSRWRASGHDRRDQEAARRRARVARLDRARHRCWPCCGCWSGFDSPGPAVFCQQRLGRDEQPFTCTSSGRCEPAPTTPSTATS